jgi:hypothetical protein
MRSMRAVAQAAFGAAGAGVAVGAVDGVVRRVQVHHHLALRPGVLLEEGVDKEVSYRAAVVDDFPVPRVPRRVRQRQLAPVEGAGAGRRVLSQRLVVDQVPIAARGAVYAPAHELLHRVLDELGGAVVLKALRELPQQAPSDEMCSASDDHQIPPPDAVAIHLFRVTCCRHRVAPSEKQKVWRTLW